nr:hypothetical protein [Tanacetum cinerariifolium]
METKDTLSSCSNLDEQEIQQLQKHVKILKENSVNKFNALKTTTQCLKRQTFTYDLLFQQAFAHLFHTDIRTFKYELSQNMNNLEKQLNNEILHGKDSKSALSMIKVQFDKFTHSDVLKPFDPYSSSALYDRENQSNTSGDERNMSRNECNDKSTSGDDTDIRPSYDTEPMDERNMSNVFQKEREQYFKIQDLKAHLQDKNIAISELKKLIEKIKGKSVDTNFEKQSILEKPPLQSIRNRPVVNSQASTQKKDAQSHKTTKRYIPVEKKSDSKNHGRQIHIGQRFSLNKSSNVYLKTTPPRSGLTWKPTGRIFTQVGLKWILIRKSDETRYNTNDSASPLGKETHNPKTVICANSSSLSAGSSMTSEPISLKGSSDVNIL